MKLYAFAPAPNAAKVLLYLAEKAAAGVPIELEHITVDLLAGEHRRPEYRTINPFGTVPAFVSDRGTKLFESLAIIEYLEERYPDPSLIGSDIESRAQARQIERIADLGVLIPVGRTLHATKSPLGRPPNPAVAEHYTERLPASLDHLEELLGDGRAFLAGDAVTVADCTLAGAMQFARFGEIELLSGRPALARWDARYRERPAAKSVLFM